MFKKSRRKIVVSIMSILIILWAGTLGTIYTSSYIEMSQQNKRMLRMHADMYMPWADKMMQKPGNHGAPGFAGSPMFQLSVFYSVMIDASGAIVETKNDRQTIHTNDELEKLAKDVIKNEKQFGSESDLLYYAADKGEYKLVVFMDNTIINKNAAMLIRYTLIFGGIALVFFFFISVYLAKKIVKPLEESYKKQKQFISDAGHELKTPVAVVSANAELLERQIGENQWLSNIQYENERMGMLVTQLLELARTENVAPVMEHVDLSHICKGEILPFETIAYEHGLELNSNIADNLLVMGNASQLKQVVSILVDNAIRHSQSGDEVYVSLKKEKVFAYISVINKGEEITKEEKEQIFERFYRRDDARTGEEGHYGLGLAIAKAIAAAHKGAIDVECYDGLVEFILKIPLT